MLRSPAIQLLYIDSRPAAVWQHENSEAAAAAATCSRHAAQNSAEPPHADCSRTVLMSQEVRSTDSTELCVCTVEGAGRMECKGCPSRQQSPVPVHFLLDGFESRIQGPGGYLNCKGWLNESLATVPATSSLLLHSPQCTDALSQIVHEGQSIHPLEPAGQMRL